MRRSLDEKRAGGVGAPGRGRLALAALLALGACGLERNAGAGDEGAEAPAAAVELAAPPGETPAARCEAHRAGALALGARSRAELRTALGEPASIEVATEPNRHVPGAVDTLSALRWPDVEARVRTAMGNDLVERIGVRADRHLRYAPGIGATEARVRELLGEPFEVDGEALVYHCAGEPIPEQPSTFILEDGRVVAVAFGFYVD